ncbi:MAG: hypothetical protein QW500_00820 [Candidatus Micrarchaeia archaeon]
MLFGLFKKKKEKASNCDEKKPDIRQVIEKLFSEMEKKGVDCAVVCFHKIPSKIEAGSLVSLGSTAYFPEDILSPTEKELIRSETPYLRVALLLGKSNEDKYVIVHERERVMVFLPVSNLWVTSESVYGPEENAWLIPLNYLLEKGIITEEGIMKTFNEDVEHYLKTTKMLCERAGVYKALEEMEKRSSTPFEQIMQEMRENIRKATQNE